MHMRKAIFPIVAPAMLRLTPLRASRRWAGYHDQRKKSSTYKQFAAFLLTLIMATALSSAASTAKQGCLSKLYACYKTCDKWPDGPIKQTCDSRCRTDNESCHRQQPDLPPGHSGVVDTGGTGKPPKAGANTSPGGGVATDPKAPPKGAGTRAPVSGAVFNQPLTTGSGGSGPILRSGGGKR